MDSPLATHVAETRLVVVVVQPVELVAKRAVIITHRELRAGVSVCSVQCPEQRLVWFKWMPTHTRARDRDRDRSASSRFVESSRTNEQRVLPRSEDANRDDDDDGAGESVGIEWKRFSKTR